MSEGARPTLHELGLKYGTDKATIHRYTLAYEQIFAPMRDLPIRLLEIGVKEGASLRMWREYFPNARIWGMDIVLPGLVDGCTLFRGDQGDAFDLAQIGEAGPFDIVIDDGSHASTHQIATFFTLFPRHVTPGGWYIIEDLHIRPDPAKTLLFFLHQFDRKQWHGVADIRMDVVGRFLAFTREK